MMEKHSVNKVRHDLYHENRSVNGYQMCHLAISFDKDQNICSILTIERKPGNEIHQNWAHSFISFSCSLIWNYIAGYDFALSATKLLVQHRWEHANKQWCQCNLDHYCTTRLFRRISTTRGWPKWGLSIHVSHIAHRLSSSSSSWRLNADQGS